MASKVASKPNHYERLGLTASAGEDEIVRAFARAMSSFRPKSAGDVAHIALAFETLRDPARRRAYDQSIAAPEPEPEQEPALERSAMFPSDGWPVIASARIGKADLPAIDSLPCSARKPIAPAEQEAAPFIAANGGETAVPDEKVAACRPEPQRPNGPPEAGRFAPGEHVAIEWKRPAVAVGGLFLGVAVLGAGLGWYASRGIAPAQAEQAVNLPVRKAPPAAADTPPAPKSAETRGAAQAPRERRTRPAAAPTRERRTPPPEPSLAEEKRADEIPDIPTEQVVALTSGAAEAPAAMPLPKSVVARTIGRIGYACGEVASTSAVDGSPGVFKVTCTSGHSYRAAPVGGRYHFRRWGGN